MGSPEFQQVTTIVEYSTDSRLVGRPVLKPLITSCSYIYSIENNDLIAMDKIN